MPEWEASFKQLIKPIDLLREEKTKLFVKMAKERAEEIMIRLSRHELAETYFDFGDLVYRPTFKNIRNNEDFIISSFMVSTSRFEVMERPCKVIGC